VWAGKSTPPIVPALALPLVRPQGIAHQLDEVDRCWFWRRRLGHRWRSMSVDDHVALQVHAERQGRASTRLIWDVLA
jgi:hypothetical protein